MAEDQTSHETIQSLQTAAGDCESTLRVYIDERALARAQNEDALPPREVRATLTVPTNGAAPHLETDGRHDTPHTFVFPEIRRPDRATLTVLAGEAAGQTFVLERGATILGRGPDSTIPIDDDTVSRHHARIVRDGDGRYSIEDLSSTNGTFLGSRRIAREMLSTGDRVQLGARSILRFALLDDVETTLQRRLYESASRDTLTGIANRRTLFERLGAATAQARRSGEELALLMIDIDHFKRVNDTFGHLAGDQLLRALATASGEVLRASDLLARYGGEELTVLARDTNIRNAATLAERLRSRLAGVRVELGSEAIGVTVSIGVSVLSECGPSGDAGAELVVLADTRLYAAKLAGRDRICAGI
jgi:diguanylate cyclase (GGDEF)-like protein